METVSVLYEGEPTPLIFLFFEFIPSIQLFLCIFKLQILSFLDIFFTFFDF